MTIYFDEDNAVDEKTAAVMEKAAAFVCEEEAISHDNISFSVSFLDGEGIRQLNREYRGVDSVTDVLSFPQFEGEEDLLNWDMEGEELMIGDVVICPGQAQKQAEEYNHSFERELIYLFVHSLFHLFGYDHISEDEKSIMREKEEKVMSKLGLARAAQTEKQADK